MQCCHHRADTWVRPYGMPINLVGDDLCVVPFRTPNDNGLSFFSLPRLFVCVKITMYDYL